MFAVQLALAVLVWGILIAALYRDRERLFRWASSLTRRARAVQAVKLLALSALMLALCLSTLPNGGLGPQGLSLGGWLSVTFCGGLFVAFQTMALVPLVLNAVEPVTPPDARASDTQNADRP